MEAIENLNEAMLRCLEEEGIDAAIRTMGTMMLSVATTINSELTELEYEGGSMVTIKVVKE